MNRSVVADCRILYRDVLTVAKNHVHLTVRVFIYVSGLHSAVPLSAGYLHILDLIISADLAVLRVNDIPVRVHINAQEHEFRGVVSVHYCPIGQVEPDVGKYEQLVLEVIRSFGNKDLDHLMEVLTCFAGFFQRVIESFLIRRVIVPVCAEICHNIVKCL